MSEEKSASKRVKVSAEELQTALKEAIDKLKTERREATGVRRRVLRIQIRALRQKLTSAKPVTAGSGVPAAATRGRRQRKKS